MNESVFTLSPRPLDKDGLRQAMLGKLIYSVGKDPAHATRHDWFFALALTVRDRLVDGWMETTRSIYEQDRKRVYYLSLEFLIGRLLSDALHNLGIMAPAREALAELGVEADWTFKVEPDAALGNGGLGRLAACLMDSMATLGIAAFGYGIRYEHGLFKQGLDDGWQVERPEDWLAFGNPWEFERAEAVYPIRFGGEVREERDATGRRMHSWDGGQRVLAVAYDTPIVGWGGHRVNTLRLWSAQSGNLVDLEAFNRGDYMRSVQDQVLSESISRVLYPNDATEAGQELRLKQEYFFTAASLMDILRRHLSYHADLRSLPDHVAIQLNDTHPAIAVPELMRLLVDEHGMDWHEAWRITRHTIHYTNHTLMPEALERWSVQLMERLLPRHLELIYEINAHVLVGLRNRPDNHDPFLTDISIIDEGHGRAVRMGNLAFLGSRKVNGVSALHGELMKQTVFRSLHRYFPDRITAIVVQNGNAYAEGLEGFWDPIRTLWNDPSPANGDKLRPFLGIEGTKWQYLTGVRDPERISPDTWLVDQPLLDRPGNQEIQLALFYDYRTNLDLYPRLQAWFRERKPPMLIAWGKNDPIFPASGATPYLRDLPEAELHLLDTGHFALEEDLFEIAGLMRDFLGRTLG